MNSSAIRAFCFGAVILVAGDVFAQSAAPAGGGAPPSSVTWRRTETPEFMEAMQMNEALRKAVAQGSSPNAELMVNESKLRLLTQNLPWQVNVQFQGGPVKD